MKIQTIDALCDHLARRGVAFSRDGDVITAGGGLYLSSLTTELQRYAGQTVRLRTIDHLCTRLIASRALGDGVTLWSAQIFKGRLDSDPRVFVAQRGEIYAHGDTAEKALRDLRFKIAQMDFDPSELIATIKRRGTITFNDYRLLTGACEAGLRDGLIARGKPGDLEEMPLKEALTLSAGAFGGARLRDLVEGGT